jgi:hypothetical protein
VSVAWIVWSLRDAAEKVDDDPPRPLPRPRDRGPPLELRRLGIWDADIVFGNGWSS